MKVSHEIPLSMLNDCRFSIFKINDYDYFLIHQLLKYNEYKELFKLSKQANRVQILDNSAYELGESFNMDDFAEAVKEFEPTEYLVPDCFNDYDKNIELFDDWMSKYSNLKGIKIVTIHGKTYQELVNAYKYFDKHDVKIAFNFAEGIYKEMGDGNPVEGRRKAIFNMLNDGIININKKHHLLGCTLAQEFAYYKNLGFIETIDTSNPIVVGLEKKWYPIQEKPESTIDDYHYTPIDDDMYCCIMYNVKKFKEMLQV